MCICFYEACAHECSWLQVPKKYISSPGARVTGWEPSSVGAENKTQVWERAMCALNGWVNSPATPLLSTVFERKANHPQHNQFYYQQSHRSFPFLFSTKCCS